MAGNDHEPAVGAVDLATRPPAGLVALAGGIDTIDATEPVVWLFRDLRSSRSGLSAREAARRLIA